MIFLLPHERIWPRRISAFAKRTSLRGYLPDNVWFLKPVFAGLGAVVCRFGIYIFVDEKLVALDQKLEHQHRFLPVWKDCRTLKADQVFLLAKPKNPSDSCYFGPISSDLIVSTAVRVNLPSCKYACSLKRLDSGFE